MTYVLIAGGVLVLVAVGLAWYGFSQARAARTERDQALGQAAAASDLASRLTAALGSVRAGTDKAMADAETVAKGITGPGDAGRFLRDGVLPPGSPAAPQGNVPPAPQARARTVVTEFGRGR